MGETADRAVSDGGHADVPLRRVDGSNTAASRGNSSSSGDSSGHNAAGWHVTASAERIEGISSISTSSGTRDANDAPGSATNDSTGDGAGDSSSSGREEEEWKRFNAVPFSGAPQRPSLFPKSISCATPPPAPFPDAAAVGYDPPLSPSALLPVAEARSRLKLERAFKRSHSILANRRSTCGSGLDWLLGLGGCEDERVDEWVPLHKAEELFSLAKEIAAQGGVQECADAYRYVREGGGGRGRGRERGRKRG